MKRLLSSLLTAALFLCCQTCIRAASMAIDSLTGAVTQNEINSFISYMVTQTPPPTPWGTLNGTGHNAWCDGSGGDGLEAFGLMYEASGDVAILNSMISWADTCVSERNDLMPAANGGQRVCWDGAIDGIWVAQDLATSHPSTGCETGDTGGHLSYCALLILQTPSLWNTTVPDGDPFGYGVTYLDRANNYLTRCDQQNDQYILKYFIQSGTDLIRDPTNSAWTGLSTPINRQSMFFRGFARLAECHQILGDAPSRVANYDAIVNAAGNECLNGMVIHSYTAKGQTVYKWYYYPWDTTHIENVGHAQYDAHGIYAVYIRSGNPAAFSRSAVNPMANAVVDVMNVATNTFSGNVDGSGTTQNYLEEGMLRLADWNPAVYDVVATADQASGRYAGSPTMDATILWMKNRRYLEFLVAAAPASQSVIAGAGTNYAVSVAPLGGFGGTVSLNVSGLPSGASASFSPGSVNLAAINSASTNSTLAVATSSSTPPGTYPLTVTGTSGSVTHTTTISLTITASGGGLTGTYEIQNEASGLVLNNQGSLTNGSAITQWTETTSSNLDWTFIPTSNGYYQVNSVKSALDAVVKGASTANGAGIIQWSFGSSGDDQWKPVQNSDGSYTFYNLHSGLVLEDTGSSTNKTTQMDQYTANGGANQNWKLISQ